MKHLRNESCRWVHKITRMKANTIIGLHQANRYLILLEAVAIILFYACDPTVNKEPFAAKNISLTFEPTVQSILAKSSKVQRVYTNDSTFIDNGILCGDTAYSCSLKFTVSKGCWSLWDGICWKILLDHSGQIEKIDLQYTKKMIRPSKYYSVGADTLYGFTCRDESLEHSGDNAEYLFSKNKGIVIVRNAGVFFNRLDYCTDQLKQIEREWRWGK